MPYHSTLSSGRFQHTQAPVFDPTTGALQVGYREITGMISGVIEPLKLLAWAIGFDGPSGASVRYEDIKTVLGNVGGDGLAAIRLPGIIGDQFGSMSERTDLIGESAMIWISALRDSADDRGAVLVAHSYALVQILTVTAYSQHAPMRPTHLLEVIAANMQSRSPEQFTSVVADRSEIMDRLPALDDLLRMLQDGKIETETYVVAT